MAYCAKCGSPLAEGQQFCGNCGQPTGQAAPGASQGAPPPPRAPYPPSPYSPSAPYAGPSPAAGSWATPVEQKRSNKGLWIALVAVVLAIVVACVLVFAVFRDDIFKGGAAASPEQTVSKLLSAMEAKDIDAVYDLMDPQTMSEMQSGMSVEDAKQAISQNMFYYQSLKFSGIEMSTEMTGDTTATVTITAGDVTVTDSDGQTSTESVSQADEPVNFDCIQRDGKWYLDPYGLF